MQDVERLMGDDRFLAGDGPDLKVFSASHLCGRARQGEAILEPLPRLRSWRLPMEERRQLVEGAA